MERRYSMLFLLPCYARSRYFIYCYHVYPGHWYNNNLGKPWWSLVPPLEGQRYLVAFLGWSKKLAVLNSLLLIYSDCPQQNLAEKNAPKSAPQNHPDTNLPRSAYFSDETGSKGIAPGTGLVGLGCSGDFCGSIRRLQTAEVWNMQPFKYMGVMGLCMII